jgi:GntR family transcriptional regulator
MQTEPWKDWHVEFHSGVPVYRQIVNWVCASLASGRLGPGDRLPSIRALRAKLGVNPATVAKAYRELELKGVIVSERGTGSYIQAEPTPPTPPPGAKERRARLESIYQRMVAEAAGCGLTVGELARHFKERIQHEPDRG